MSYFLIAGSASFSARPNRRHVPIVGDDRGLRGEAAPVVAVQMFFGDGNITTNPERGRPIRSSLEEGWTWHLAVAGRGLSFSVDGYDRFSIAKIDCYGAELDLRAEETCVLLGDPEVDDFRVVSSGGASRGSVLAAMERAWNEHRSQPRFRRAFDAETDSFRSVRLEQERRFIESLDALDARDAIRERQLDAIRGRQLDALASAVGIPARVQYAGPLSGMKDPFYFPYLKTKKFVKLVLALKRVGQAEQRARDRVLNWQSSEDEDAVDRRFRLLEVR